MTGGPVRRFGDPLAWALFLQGTALLGLEVVLARVLAVAMWHHFASLVISLSLLGMTAGSLWVYLRRDPPGTCVPPQRLPARAAFLAGAAGLVAFLFFLVICRFPVVGTKFLGVFYKPHFEPFAATVAGDIPLMVLNLLILFIVLGLPFFAAGVFITAVFTQARTGLSRLYAADLLGGGFGCWLAVALLTVTDGFSALLLAAIPSLGAAALLEPSRRMRLAALGTAGVMVCLALANTAWPLARFDYVHGRYQPRILHEAWDATSRVVVYPLTGGQEEGSWGQSRLSTDPVPPQLGLVVDDTGFTTITRFPEDGNLEFMRRNIIALPYVVKPQAEALIIGPGGGRDILAAQAMGARSVTAVEINPLVVDAVDRVFGEFSGRLYSRPGVTTRIAEGRHYLQGDPRRYDVLQASLVYGRLPSSAGAFTLSEEHLYTAESFREYFGHLKPGGVLAVTRFIYEKRVLRLLSLARTVLEEAGRPEPGDHVFIAAERGLATVLIKAEPFSAAELSTLGDWCRRWGFQVLYAPGRDEKNAFTRLLEAPSLAGYLAASRFDAGPPTDDRPYFYYVLRPGDFWRTMALGGGMEFEDRAVVIVRNALAVLLLLTLVLVALPLSRRLPGGGKPGLVLAVVGYFGGIALGFMVIEILLLKTLLLHLGYPVLSLTVVLAALLVSAGLGSWATRSLLGTAQRLGGWILLTVAAAGIFRLLADPVLSATAGLALPWRIVIASLLILPLGFCLGGALPAGLELLGRRAAPLVPWAFGLNGAVSVLASMVTLVLALNYGYRLTWLLAPASYLLAFAGLWFMRERS